MITIVAKYTDNERTGILVTITIAVIMTTWIISIFKICKVIYLKKKMESSPICPSKRENDLFHSLEAIRFLSAHHPHLQVKHPVPVFSHNPTTSMSKSLASPLHPVFYRRWRHGVINPVGSARLLIPTVSLANRP